MCNPKSSSNYYRCDCDTSEKRQLRRVNRKARDLVVNPLTPVSLQEAPSAYSLPFDYTPSADPHENIRNLQNLYEENKFDNPNAVLILKEIGNNVETLAEQRAGITSVELQAEADNVGEALKEKNANNHSYDELSKMSEEERTEMWERATEIGKRYSAAEKAFNEKFEKMGLAYREIISEIRGEPMGAGEEGIVVSDAKPQYKALAKKMERRLDCFPQSWIAASNAAKNLAPRESKRRAHYASTIKVSTGRRIIPYVTSGNESFSPDEEHKFEELTPQQLKDNNIEVHPGERYYQEVDWTHYSQWEHGKLQEDGTPPGPRWKLMTIKRREYRDGETHFVEETKWMRKKPPARNANAVKGTKLVSEITFPKVGKDGYGEFTAKKTTIHEFAHRMEDCVPRLKHLEAAYIDSRKESDKKVRIYDDGRAEYAADAGFRELYSGKTYPDGSSEVMSTGMEVLFTREDFRNGVFVSDKNPQMDTDFRDFVLGTIATVKTGAR